MTKIKHHRGRMSFQGKEFLDNIKETNVETIKKMFFEKFGKHLTAQTIERHLKSSKPSVKKNALDKVFIHKLTPRNISIIDRKIVFADGPDLYEMPLNAFNTGFPDTRLSVLKGAYVDALKEELRALNAEI
tara:strand:+ start:74 stop:466 length:393 start_codon:yes stop_codon:yes gene_type:complete